MTSLATAHELSPQTQAAVKAGKIPQDKLEAYNKLVGRINNEILTHEVIVNNQFTKWFKQGQFDNEDARHFFTQFSVFSNLFIVAQLKKTLNAPTIEAMHASKEILLNELGVVFRKESTTNERPATEEDFDPNLVAKEGTIDGGMFRFPAAHFEWMLRMISHVGLTFNDVGKRRHGTKSTLFFCDELSRIYGSEDPHVALGASFGVENWAAAGFWKELIQGLKIFKEREVPAMPLGFFTWHDMVEDQHAQHTWNELQEEFFTTEVDQEKFISSSKEMLDGVLAFWNGLNEDRLKREGERTIG